MASSPSESAVKKHPGVTPRSFYAAGILLLVFNNLASAIQYIFQCLMGRHLSTADFGLMNSLFQLGMFMALPVTVYITVMTRRWSEMIHFNHVEEAESSWYAFLILSGIFAVVITLLGWAFMPVILWWLKTSNTQLVALLILSVGVSILINAAVPYVTARQWFGFLAFGSILSSVLRLAIGYAGIKLNHPLAFAIMAYCLAGFLFFFLTTLRIRCPRWKDMPFKKVLFHPSEWTGSLLLTLSSFFILGSDLLAVQRVFSAHEAGTFAQVSILARIIFFLIGPLATVVLPKSATSLMEGGSETRAKVLWYAMTLSFGILVLAAAGLCWLSPLALHLLTGKIDTDSVFYLRVAVWCFIPLSLCQLIIPSLFAGRREKELLEFTVLSALLPVGIFIFHQELMHAFIVEGGVGVILLGHLVVRMKFMKPISPIASSS